MEYYEQTVSVKKTKGTRFYQALIIVIIAILFFISSIFVGMIGPIFALAVGVFAFFYAFPRMTMDFEYVMTANMFTIDVIYGNAKRRNIITFDVKEAVSIFKSDAQGKGSGHVDRIYKYLSGRPSNDVYAIDLKLTKQTIRLLIEPDEKLLRMLKVYGSQKFARF